MNEQMCQSVPQTPFFQLLWIEDQILQLAASMEEIERLLNESDQISRPVKTQGAEWVAKAEEVFETLRESPPDLIVLDTMLPRTLKALKADPPRIDHNAGFMLWHRLRKQKEWGAKLADVPILVLTAMPRPLFRPMMENEDRLKWLDKPAKPSAIANEIIALIASVHQSG